MAASINHAKGKKRFVEWGLSFLLYIYTAHIPAHIKSENSYFSYIYIYSAYPSAHQKEQFFGFRGPMVGPLSRKRLNNYVNIL